MNPPAEGRTFLWLLPHPLCPRLTETVQGGGREDHVSLRTSAGHPGDAEGPREPEELQHCK